MPSILAFGNQGRITQIGRPDHFDRLSPLAEVDYSFEAEVIPTLESSDLRTLIPWIEPIYERYGKFGPFGDVIFIAESSDICIITNIGRVAYNKPALASDLIPVVVKPDGSKIVIAILRGKPPGAGLPAFIGGFHNINGLEMDSSIDCLVGEGREEAGLKIRRVGSRLEDLFNPFPQFASVEVQLGKSSYETNMVLVGHTYTGPSEHIPTLGLSRVSMTTAYLLPIFLDRQVIKEELLTLLVPEDTEENTSVFLQEINSDGAYQPINFGLEHHHWIWESALPMIQSLTIKEVKVEPELSAV